MMKTLNLNESKMACMPYFPKIRKIAYQISKDFLIDEELQDTSHTQKRYNFKIKNDNISIVAYPYWIFEELVNDETTLGFFSKRTNSIHIKIQRIETVSELVEILMHELEHYFDEKKDRVGTYYDSKTIMWAHNNETAVDYIRYIKYCLFSRTEFNAFCSSFFDWGYYSLHKEHRESEPRLFRTLQQYIDYLKQIPFKGHEFLWHWVIPNDKIGDDDTFGARTECTPMIRKHFLHVAQSRLNHLRKVTYRKYMYFVQHYRMGQNRTK